MYSFLVLFLIWKLNCNNKSRYSETDDKLKVTANSFRQKFNLII